MLTGSSRAASVWRQLLGALVWLFVCIVAVSSGAAPPTASAPAAAGVPPDRATTSEAAGVPSDRATKSAAAGVPPDRATTSEAAGVPPDRATTSTAAGVRPDKPTKSAAAGVRPDKPTAASTTSSNVPEVEAPAPPPEVRTGTTRVEIPEPDAHPTAGAVAQTFERAPPLDSPRLAARELSVPEPPPSFNVYEGGWVRFAYPPSVLERVRPLISEADAIKAELAERLAQSSLKKVTVYVARTPGEMATLAPPGAPYPKYAAGVAYPDIGLVLLSIHPVHPNANHDVEEIFRHELAHLALHDALSGRPVPRWFNEGFAVLASGETSLTRYRELMTATLSDTLLPFSEIERSFPADELTVGVAYAEAVDVVRFLMRQEEHHRFAALVERVRKGQSFEAALKDAYGVDLATLEYEWREDVAKRYTFWPVLFSGSVVWVGTIGLFVLAWRRRRKRSQDTLERWAREEAAEDALKHKLAAAEASDRVHIVIARRNPPQLPPRSDVDVPKVEHDGQWHTLH